MSRLKSVKFLILYRVEYPFKHGKTMNSLLLDQLFGLYLTIICKISFAIAISLMHVECLLLSANEIIIQIARFMHLYTCKQLIILVKSIGKGSCSKAYKLHDYQ